jgi:hypothetical protein
MVNIKVMVNMEPVMNKFFLLIVLFFSFMVGYVDASGNKNPNSLVDGTERTLRLVDHVNHRLVIDDEVFYMPLNFKVYIKSQYSTNNRLANRYALKAGQSVFIDAAIRSRKNYVNVLVIHSQ